MIKVYKSTQTGAPQSMGIPNSLTSIMDSVLVNGFNITSPDSLTRVGTVATALVNIGHGYEEGDVLLISGADQSEYNGEFTIYNVTNTTFDYTVVDTAVSPATGSISMKISPLDWEIPFSDTNRRVYRAKEGNRHYLRLDENYFDMGADNGYVNGDRVAILDMFETMTDIDTGTGQQDGDVLIRKSAYDGGGPHYWWIVGNKRTFFIFIVWQTSSFSLDGGVNAFGEFESFLSGDTNNTFIIGTKGYGTSSYGWLNLSNDGRTLVGLSYDPDAHSLGSWLLKDWLGQVSCKFNIAQFSSDASAMDPRGSRGYTVNVPDQGKYFRSVFIKEHDGVRGKFPAFYTYFQELMSTTSLQKVSGIMIDGVARDLLLFGRFAIDVTGPW